MKENGFRKNRTNIITVVLLVYLGVMAYIGLPELYAGNYLYYFGIIAATLVCIIALHRFNKRRDRLRSEREADMKRRDDD